MALVFFEGRLVGGLLARKAERALNSRAAGGLPQHFALAVTPTHLRAYELRYGGRALVQVGAEAAAWERSGLEVTHVDRGGLKTNVTLQPAGGSEFVCSAGTHESTDRFIALLQHRT